MSPEWQRLSGGHLSQSPASSLQCSSTTPDTCVSSSLRRTCCRERAMPLSPLPCPAQTIWCPLSLMRVSSEAHYGTRKADSWSPEEHGILVLPSLELSSKSNLSAHKSTLNSLLESGLSWFQETLKLAPVIGRGRKALGALTCPSNLLPNFFLALMPSQQVAVCTGWQHCPQRVCSSGLGPCTLCLAAAGTQGSY